MKPQNGAWTVAVVATILWTRTGRRDAEKQALALVAEQPACLADVRPGLREGDVGGQLDRVLLNVPNGQSIAGDISVITAAAGARTGAVFQHEEFIGAARRIEANRVVENYGSIRLNRLRGGQDGDATIAQ